MGVIREEGYFCKEMVWVGAYRGWLRGELDGVLDHLFKSEQLWGIFRLGLF